ncbi:hypothetical protein BDA99DRAFT_185480 [Phascolomyces articulosus]|uniref:BRCT domain-containing protein n=1 Tax=Phascolomyces articulosus TaxID=60185 RepID=A0AAD5JS97_9FUNG|nr:hypothetical protein BDA99DRAFT_185480 [Phascolomyces articulosus]
MPNPPSKRRSIRFGKESVPRSSMKPSGSTPDLQQLSLNSFFKNRHGSSTREVSSSSHKSNANDTSTTTTAMTESKRVNGHDPMAISPSSSDTMNKNSSITKKVDPSQILKGVIACLDIRTEDGDDVSQSFERSLQSMGAKTRRTFSDSITHLIYKNGSTATLRKALGKKVVIVNLLWITRCKSEGKRLSEKEFLIDRPQGIIMSAKKRRKSMEPGKVKALEMESATSSPFMSKQDLDGSNEPKRKRHRSDSVSEPRARRLSEKDPTGRRQRLHHHSSSMMDSSAWKAEDIPSHSNSDNEEEDEVNVDEDEDSDERPKKKPSKVSIEMDGNTSSNSSDDATTEKNNNGHKQLWPVSSTSSSIKPEKRRESALFTPEMRERSNQIKAQIKADFFIQDAEPSNKPASPKPSSRLSLGSSNTLPLRRKRRSMGPNTTGRPSLPVLPVPSSLASSSSSSTPTPAPTPFKSPVTRFKQTIVMTGMTQQLREKCINIVRRLGSYEIGTFVDSRTTHVIVGSKRRTESVLSGMTLKLWLVTPDWLLKCGEAGKYVDETKFEATNYFERASIARTSTKQLLPSNLHICVHSVHALTKESMEQLVTRANGKIVHALRDADIVVSKTPLDTDKVVVNENWLFYCIEQWKYLPFDKFTLEKS